MPPKGFRRVEFQLTNNTQDEYKIACLVCDECQAMVLQNDFGEFASKHRKWHEKLNTKEYLTYDNK